MNRLPAPLTTRLESGLSRFAASQAGGGPYDTTDHYLSPLEIPRPSETVLSAMSGIPPDQGIVFIGSGDDESVDLIHHSVSYLGWPRPIGEVRCGAAGGPASEIYLPPVGKTVKWLMFYRVSPPPDLAQTSRSIGPHLSLTPASELKAWKLYCSQ